MINLEVTFIAKYRSVWRFFYLWYLKLKFTIIDNLFDIYLTNNNYLVINYFLLNDKNQRDERCIFNIENIFERMYCTIGRQSLLVSYLDMLQVFIY